MSDDAGPAVLTSDEIPHAMVYGWNGGEEMREVHSAKRKVSECPTCNLVGEIWEFRLLPLEQHPNYLRVHRGKFSCGILLGSINPMGMALWTLKDRSN